MRSLSLAIALTVAVAMVLTFSVRSYNEERTRLRQNFVVARQADVRELASDLESRLRDLEEDGRVIEALIGRTYDSSGTDRDDRTRAVHASFDALATVIRHYKTLVLLSSGNSVPVVVATDVSEAPS
ncbi:MAG TPA: hypothetical protein VMT03_00580, partial [Polyangia bacterium]|nr:hypothetical protein [Polyangia bacterium]